VCAITQYNASLDTGHQKAAWALAAGNSVVLEPSPYTAGTAGVMAKAPLAAGLPPAMISFLHRGADLARSNPKNPACAYVNEPAAPRSPAT